MKSTLAPQVEIRLAIAEKLVQYLVNCGYIPDKEFDRSYVQGLIIKVLDGYTLTPKAWRGGTHGNGISNKVD